MGEPLYGLLGHAPADRESLANRNVQRGYGSASIEDLLTALGAGGAWTRFYDAADCERVAEAINAAGGGA